MQHVNVNIYNQGATPTAADTQITTTEQLSESHTLTESNDTERRSVSLRTNSRRFRQCVLDPRAIHYSDKAINTAFAHFKTLSPARNMSAYEHYTALAPRLRNVDLWLATDDATINEIQEDYTELQLAPQARPEWLIKAIEHFFTRDRLRVPAHVAASAHLPKRLFQTSYAPQPSAHWLAPPCAATTAALPPDHRYNFSITPDLSYWINNTAPGARTMAAYIQHRATTHVRATCFCPYLSVLVRTALGRAASRNELAAAGALALFNRWRLHADALRLASSSTQDQQSAAGDDDDDVSVVRHYGILMAGVAFEVCVFVADTSEDDGNNDDNEGNNGPSAAPPPPLRWAGCRITTLASGNLTEGPGVELLLHWINEIHAWGGAVHARACKREIGALVGLKEDGGGSGAAGEELPGGMRALTLGE